MKEIKFRCWYDNHMFDVTDIDFAYKMINLTGADIIKFTDGILMQYTGIEDINGKEIYEGDIVSKEVFDDTKPNYRNVSYAKVMYIEELSGFYLTDKDNKIYWSVAYDKNNIEVVSSIYDNPELLEE